MYWCCYCCVCPYLNCYISKGTAYSLPKKRNIKDVNNIYRQKQFTIEELAKYDGSEGKPAYTAVNGIVYDMSLQPAWGGGTHFGLVAGKDLTAQFEGCHPASTILDKLPKVGVMK